MRIVRAFLIAALLWPAAADARSLLNPQWGAIFAAGQAPQLLHQCSRATPAQVSGVWQPTPAQIAVLEPKLSDLLTRQLIPFSNYRPSAADYYRQYGGLIVNGRQIIYVNGFYRALLTSTPNMDWRVKPVQICDGGIISFGVEYDPASGALSHFAFNGHL
ncbi:MAG TPA: hypothetical protein VII56_03690 [Rhizomicrobium sp.]